MSKLHSLARDFRRMGIEVIFLNEVGNGFEIPSYWGSIFDCRNIYFSGSDCPKGSALRAIAFWHWHMKRSLSTLLLISSLEKAIAFWHWHMK
jgi:hypothetical protein